jgi:cyanate permease
MASNGGSISALVMVPVIARLIDSYGWRDAWSILGVIALVTMLPLVPLVVRSPEDFGLEPDNGYRSPPGRRNASAERSYHLRDVVRAGSFWFLMFGVLVGNYSLQAHTVVIIPRLEEIGYTSEEAAAALSLYGLFSLAMRFVWGNLADTRGVRLAIVAQSALSAIGALLLFQVAGPWTLYPIIAFQGLVMSGYPPLQIMVWPEFFGRDYIGSIVGLTQPFVTMSGAAAPVIVGALHDTTGSYAAPLWMLAGTWLLCTTVMVLVKPGVRSETTAAVPAG